MVSTPNSPQSGFFWKPLLITALALLAVRIGVLLLTPLTLQGDEAQYWTWSRDIDFGYYSKPPLIAWAIGFSTWLFGNAEWAVRLPSCLFQIATGLVLAMLGRRLFDDRTGLWAGIVWMTLPAVAFSSLLMSTDALLLTFWALALLQWDRLVKGGGWADVLVLAIAFGLGLNAKYAMSYFLLCAALHLVISREARRGLLTNALKPIVGFVLGGTMILPNVWWNAAHGWATVGHTADNANYQGIVLHFDKFGEFLGSQFGVFGPILFAAFILCLPWTRQRIAALTAERKFLIAFSVPILLLVCGLSLMSRANANWAATAFPAATLLTVHVLMSRPVWIKASVALHVAVALLLYGAVVMPDASVRLLGRDPFKAIPDWTDVAREVEAAAQASGTSVLLLDDRMITASLSYALRDRPLILRAWNHDAKIDHHYEMAWLYRPQDDGDRVLLVTPHGVDAIVDAFDQATVLPPITLHGRAGRDRTLELRLLEGAKQ
ncbi:glycosyltransferase family 39 protein [Rhodospirillaceae bacterium KN72]|uniref:Glycosyltransferase family 39 protein n=1 Tax=Pacificispira spongiicola TaxID=2729598 RepID=A0A7Y0E1P6_9PROT|nr:glycosyltransferase family 39 protein [Pacificispira spongiicola]NMM45528.1 glycosyltransferase family 39 protein [Pacificispira spongiicola]